MIHSLPLQIFSRAGGRCDSEEDRNSRSRQREIEASSSSPSNGEVSDRAFRDLGTKFTPLAQAARREDFVNHRRPPAEKEENFEGDFNEVENYATVAAANLEVLARILEQVRGRNWRNVERAN